LRAMPRQLQDPPTSFDGMVFAVRRGRIPPLHRLVDPVSERHHTREQWCAPATALWPVVHCELEQTRVRLLLLMQRGPLGGDGLDDAVARFRGAAKGDGQRTALCIHDPTRHIHLLAAPIVITGSVVTTGETTTGTCADFHRRFPGHTPAFDLAC